MTKLKPCPFCGEKVTIDKDFQDSMKIRCCSIDMEENWHNAETIDEYIKAINECKKEIIKRWNTRAKGKLNEKT